MSQRAFMTRSSSTTSTQLFEGNLFDRFSRVAKANLNNVLKKIEDPEKVMDQAVTDMQADLIKVRQSYAEVYATQKRLVKQQEAAAELATSWYDRAQLALKAGDEELAREALVRRQQQVDVEKTLAGQVAVQQANINKMYDGMGVLEGKITEARTKKDQMVARARTASTTTKVNDMLSGVTGKSSMDAFTRMEEKVEMMEAQAEVSEDMALLGGEGTGTTSLEGKFAALEGENNVDDEMEKMKKLLTGGGSGGDEVKVIEGVKGVVDNSGIDAELEALRKEAGL
ncbi:hypothetical protein ScalyP_jg7966 [Parmales sp. scaly parma]|nr:hypothetical protein ScalyP_jg7966 [Parmales sp. scaly parma]